MTIKEQKYILQSVCYALFVPLHILNTWGVGPVKLFHIPVFIMGLFGFWNLKAYYEKHKIVKWLLWFVACSAIPVVVSGFSTVSNYATLTLLIVSVLPLIDINKRLILQLTPSMMLIAMWLAKQYAEYDYNNMFMRFKGLYNDANYMVMSVMAGTFLSIIAFSTTNILNKIIIICELGLGLNFLLLSQSRGGLFAVVFMLFMGLLQLYRSQKVLATSLICLACLFSGTYIATNQDRIDAFSNRMDDMGKETSTQTRFLQAQEAWKGAKNHPEMIVFGVGVGKTGEVRTPLNKRPDNVISLVYHQTHTIHMTPVAIWFEHGTIALICYIVFNTLLLIKIVKERNLFVIGFYLAMTFQSCTIKTTEYLPYWVAIALCINAKTLFNDKMVRKSKNLDSVHENTSHRLGLI